MLTVQERSELIAKIQQLPSQIEALVAGLTADQLTAHPLAGQWSVAQNVHHLFDAHANAYIRCRLIVTEENPPLKPYDQDQWAEFADAAQADVATSLSLLRGLHERWDSFWQTRHDSEWERSGLHAQMGIVTLERILLVYAGHGEAHIEQIRRTLAAAGIERSLSGSVDRSFQSDNSAETGKLARLIARLSDADMEKQVSHGWTIKATLLHLAFYDMRALTLIDKFEKGGVSQSATDIETINEVVRQVGDAMSGAAAAQLWQKSAEALDKRIETLPDSMIAAVRMAGNPFKLPRHNHRAEHRVEIEKVIG